MSHIEKSSDDTQFYMVQYKEEAETTWKNRSYKTFSPIYTEYLVDNLKAGRKYFMRVILVDESLKTNDPEFSTMSEVSTNCRVSKIETNLNVTKVTKTSIAIIWNKESVKFDDKECPFGSYILDIEKPRDDFVENRKIVNIQRNSLVIRSLLPGTTYTISLKKSTVHGESSTVSHVQATTDQSKDSVMYVAGLRKTVMGSEVHLQWLKSAFIRTYFIKYRMLNLLACSTDDLKSPLHVVPTKSTNYTLKLTPNAQYELFVTGDETLSTNENKQTVITKGRLPDIAPVLLRQGFRVTNESAAIHWKDPPENCQKMNGFFKKYLLELMDIHNTIINTYETVDRKMEITGLDPKTEYNLRVKYVNHIGSSRQTYDAASFHTRATSFLIAQDLTAYKTGRDLIGLRWKSFDTKSTISGINIYLQDPIWNKTITVTEDLRAFQCKAWPDFVCFDVNELMSNRNYTIRVETLPEETQSNTIHAVTRETATSLPVSDIKAEYNNTSITVSWRIPHLLNGILRGFVLELEHLASFDDDMMCCQSLMNINYTVSSEQERYLYVLQNIMPASCYQISIRPFTKRLGPATNQIIDTPPLPMPFQTKPQIKLDNEAIQWKEENQTINPAENTELITETLIIVQEFNGDANVTQTVPDTFRSEMYRTLASNAWWLTHVCAVDDDPCSLNLRVHDYQNYTLPYYGQVVKKPLQVNHQYRIVAAQVNRYLSARSYTILATEYFTMK
uniref:Fibronectin type-III domain-containing protein n=1 Tax=Cacopsylla melanoneura TaxID=428564 RepID=A0A8D8UGA3_9HEMI